MNLIKNQDIVLRFLKLSAVFVMVSALFFAKISFANAYENSFIVAKINNKVITNLELTDRYHFVLFSSKIQSLSGQDKESLLNQIIDKMVDEELIRQEAENLKISATNDEIKNAIELVALRQKKNTVQFKLNLLQQNISFANYAKQIESELLWSKIISEVLRSRVKITDAETKEFFEQQKFNINVRKLFIAQIFIPQDDNHSNHAAIISKKLVTELRNGADFQSIVKQFSRDSISVEHNGEIGWVSQNDIDQRIYAEVSKLKKGGYSDPILLSEGYYIFKLIDSKVETKIEDQDLNIARNHIFVKKLQNLAKGYLMDLRKRAFIEVDRKRLLVGK
jgi:peptidyl-prolyl cis-trans isomerase SurA